MITGRLFDIQRFSISDGPGVRTSVFLKGCNLRCAWCHNPESQSMKTEIRYAVNKCIGCGLCVHICPNGAHRVNERSEHVLQRSKCSVCTKCVDMCNPRALEVIGKEFTVEQVMDEVLKDRELYTFSGGGMTVTGGEPLMQKEFTFALLKAAHAHEIHTAIETAGHASWDALEMLAQETDLFLYDVKGFDSEHHRMNTGQGNEQILDNLQRLSQKARVFVRMPLIAGLNDSLEEARLCAQFLKTLGGVEQIELLPYHRFGEAKYALVGRKAVCFEAPLKEHMNALAEIYENAGKKVIVHAS